MSHLAEGEMILYRNENMPDSYVGNIGIVEGVRGSHVVLRPYLRLYLRPTAEWEDGDGHVELGFHRSLVSGMVSKGGDIRGYLLGHGYTDADIDRLFTDLGRDRRKG